MNLSIFKKNIEISDIMKSIKRKNLLIRLGILCIALFISAISFNLLQLPINLVTGGTSGVSIITNHLFHIKPSYMLFGLSLTFLILSVIFLGIEQSSGAILATFLYPFFVDITSKVPEFIKIENSDMLLLSIFIGIIAGITNGLTFKVGFSNGGFNVISQILYQKKKISISTSSFLINLIIVVTGGYFFGWTMVMYAIIVLYINSIVVDRVLMGISKNKAMYIITHNEEEVKDYILNDLNHGITTFDVKGGYNNEKRKVLMTVVPNSEYFKVTEGVKSIDKKAFFIVTDSYQVFGNR